MSEVIDYQRSNSVFLFRQGRHSSMDFRQFRQLFLRQPRPGEHEQGWGMVVNSDKNGTTRAWMNEDEVGPTRATPAYAGTDEGIAWSIWTWPHRLCDPTYTGKKKRGTHEINISYQISSVG